MPVCVAGAELACVAHRWRFFLQELSDGHWVSVARGPPENIVDAWREFTGTLQEPDIPGAKFQVGEQSNYWTWNTARHCEYQLVVCEMVLVAWQLGQLHYSSRGFIICHCRLQC